MSDKSNRKLRRRNSRPARGIYPHRGDASKPTCSKCGATGTGAMFSVFSKFGFGKYCVPCEKIVSAGVENMRAACRAAR